MKKFGILGALILVALIVIGVLGGTYNSLVKSREEVRSAVNTLQSQYQRRNDLVPQLVNTVKGSANFEKSTLESVINARAKATSVTIDPSNITPEQLQQFQAAQGELSSALSRLIAVSENYPELRTTAAFQDLMSQLEGTENRIQVARSDYGNIAKNYNARVQTFPTNLIAGMFGFKTFPYFTAESEKAPDVNFDSLTPATAQ